MNLHEVGGVLSGEGDAGGAVGLVADDEIEVIHAELLGFVDGFDGLVGGEDDVEALAALALLRTMLDISAVGGDGDIEIVGGDVLGFLGDLLVRAHGVGLEWQVLLRLGGPLLERLREQRDGGNEEEDAGLVAVELREALGEAQRSEGLAGAAGHDELAAVVGLEAGDGLRDGLLLVRTRGVHLLAG